MARHGHQACSQVATFVPRARPASSTLSGICVQGTAHSSVEWEVRKRTCMSPRSGVFYVGFAVIRHSESKVIYFMHVGTQSFGSQNSCGLPCTHPMQTRFIRKRACVMFVTARALGPSVVPRETGSMIQGGLNGGRRRIGRATPESWLVSDRPSCPGERLRRPTKKIFGRGAHLVLGQQQLHTASLLGDHRAPRQFHTSGHLAVYLGGYARIYFRAAT